jgi:hypothetical protein
MNINQIAFFYLTVVILFSSFGCKNNEKTISGDLSIQIDHLVICISNLDEGINQFYELSSIKPVFSGEHPGRSTQNALVSLSGMVETPRL